MGITVHWLMRDELGHLKLCARLLAIHEVQGRHNGKNLASTFVDILKMARILNRVRQTICLTDSH